MARHSSYLGSYLNDFNCILKDWNLNYAQNAPKLAQIKNKYDPQNIFHRSSC